MNEQANVSAANQLVNGMVADLLESKSIFRSLGQKNEDLKVEIAKYKKIVNQQQALLTTLEGERDANMIKMSAGEVELRKAAAKYRLAAERKEQELGQSGGVHEWKEKALAAEGRAKAAEAKILEVNMEIGRLRWENDSFKRRLDDNTAYIATLEATHEEQQAAMTELKMRLDARV